MLLGSKVGYPAIGSRASEGTTYLSAYGCSGSRGRRERHDHDPRPHGCLFEEPSTPSLPEQMGTSSNDPSKAGRKAMPKDHLEIEDRS